MQTFFKTAAVDRLPMQKYTWKIASNSLKNPGILWLRKSGNPVQQPEEPEEDWGDTPPVLIPIPITPGPPPQTTRAIKRQRYLQRRRERKRQDEWEGNQN